MKKIRLTIFALLIAATAAAQNPSAYFMEGSTLRSQYNPAFAPLRGYINIPGLGGLNANVNGNLSLDKILYPRDGRLVTLLDSSIPAAEALRHLKPKNMLGVDTRVNIIGFGAFTRNHKNFWSVSINARVNSDANIPYTLFEFLKEGSSVDIRDIGISADSYLEAVFNYSFPVNDRLYIGASAKFLTGVARARLNYDHMSVSMQEDKWLVNTSGVLDITAAGQDIHTRANSNGTSVYELGDIDLKPTSPVGYGFAVDLGATYDIFHNLQASLAVTDLGFISWGKSHNTTGASVSELMFAGMEIENGNTQPQPDFNLDVLKFEQRAPQSVTRMLRATINAGLEYEVWRHKIGIGLLYSTRFWQYKTLHSITGSVNFHPVRWFTVTGSYSAIGNRGGAFGLALNLNPSWINFFVATDVVAGRHTTQFIPIKQSNMNLTVGLGVPLGRNSHRIEAYTYNNYRYKADRAKKRLHNKLERRLDR